MNERVDHDESVPPGLISALVDEQRRSWQNGERVLVESFLPRVPGLNADRAGLLDLIYSEIVLREEVGERPTPREYLERFPHLRDELTLQFEVDRALNLELLTEQQPPVEMAKSEPPVEKAIVETPLEPFFGMRWPDLPGYEIIGILGRGKRGVVYKARRRDTGRVDAVKVVLTGIAAETGWLRGLRTEVDAFMRLRQTHFVAVHEIGILDGRLFIAMELLEGSVAARLANGAVVDPRQAAQWLTALARAIHEAHQRGRAHRNLKLSNVLIASNDVVKISDFGVERGEPPSQSEPRSPDWLPPDTDQVDGAPKGSDQDIYALGAVLHELLTGRPPDAETPAKLPRGLDAICYRCLHENRRRRYASAAALAADLQAYLADKPIRARRRGWLEGATRGIGTRIACLSWYGLIVLALAALVVGVLWSHALVIAGVAVLCFLSGISCCRAFMIRRHEEMQAERTIALRTSARRARLFDLSSRLIRNERAENALPLILETALWLVDAERAIVFHLDAERHDLVARSKGQEIRVPIGGGIVGEAAKQGEAIHVPNPEADSRFDAALDRRTGQKTRNLVAVPVRNAIGAVVGVIQFVNKRDGSFSDDDIALLVEFFAAIGGAIEKPMEADKVPK